MHVFLGNISPKSPYRTEEQEKTGEVSFRKLDTDKAVTVTRFPEGVKLAEAFTTAVAAYDGYHSDDPPEWVESDNDALEALLAEHYGCKRGMPKTGWNEKDLGPYSREAAEDLASVGGKS